MLKFLNFITTHVVQSKDWELSIFLKMYDMIMSLMQRQSISVLIEEDVENLKISEWKNHD